MHPPRVVIVTPGSPTANAGNWQTARRWQALLRAHCTVRLTGQWTASEVGQDDVMLALHARRSADSVSAWHQLHGARGLGLVLTGTDLYRDIEHDTRAQQSLAQAAQLVVLQEMAPWSVPEAYRAKTRVIFQSTRHRQTLPKTARHLRVVMAGHLREEKDPLTLMAAARLLRERHDILIDHIGGAMDAALADAARATQAACPHYRWLGTLSHAQTRQRIQRAHLLVHTSRMEGGAHVVMEAICSGTPVLASRIDGNLGLLGAQYSGVFEVGDAQALAHWLAQCRSGQAPDCAASSPLQQLSAQCAQRTTLFAPDTERAALRQLVAALSR